MRHVASNVCTEVYIRGCNPSFIETSDGFVMIDSPQQPIDAVRWRERMEDKAPIRYLINTEWHGDHIRGNAYFPNVEVIGQERLLAGFERHVFSAATGRDAAEIRERMIKNDPDSAWLVGHPDYPLSNPPKRTFSDRMTLEVGNHRFECIHMPGHTECQTSIHVPQEGVVFTGDNVFCGCKTWLSEADPWAWLDSLDAIAALDVETIVPGHGEPCGKPYLARQRDILLGWMDAVGRMVDAGIDVDEAAGRPIDVDPYPMGQRLEAWDAWLMAANIRNLHGRLLARREGQDQA